MGKKSAKLANGDQANKGVKDVIEKGKKVANTVASAVLPQKTANGKSKKNGVKKEVSSDEESSDSESDDEESASESSESSDSDSSESESDSDNEAPAKKETAKVKRTAATAADGSSDDDSSEDGSDAEIADAPMNGKAEDSSDAESEAGSDASDDDSASEAEQSSPKKRKADVEEESTAKKAKTFNGEAKAVNGASTNGIKNLFVGNLSWNIDEEWLAREFEQYGEIERVNIITDKNTGRSKGFGYVEFSTAEDAQKAHDDMKGKQIDGRDVNIDYSTPRTERPDSQKFKADSRAKSFGDQTSPESDTLFVGNVSFEADENMLSEAFGEWGTVRQVRLPTDPDSGSLKGFGYIQFASVDEAKVALENMRGAEIAGRTIRLDFTTPRTNSGGGRGGGSNFRRGGGGFGGGGFGSRGDFGSRGRGGGRGRGGFGRGGPRGGGRGGSTNRGGFGDFSGRKTTFD